MREIFLRDKKSADSLRKDVDIKEEIQSKSYTTTYRKHCRFIIKILDKIDDINNIDEVFISQLVSQENSIPDRQIYITKRISDKKGINEIDYKIEGSYFLVFNNLLLKIKYIFDWQISITRINQISNP